MASLNFDDDGVHRLEGSSGEQSGGLVIMKKKKQSGEGHAFKKPEAPKTSLLGLDRLAALKRQTENDGSTTPKRSKVSSYLDEDDDVEDDRSSSKSKESKERYIR